MRKTKGFLAVLLCLALGLWALEATKTEADKASAPLMREAAARTRQAFEALKAERLARGLPWDAADDPNATGMIGPAYTDITTTLGALDAKRSTTNPNVAAMLADMLLEVGLGRGDHIAVNLSGSFPCLNIALLCAMDTLGIEGTVLFSVGASTYGATLPDFTYGDMEHFLYANGLITARSAGFSLGGENDQGLEMPEALRTDITTRLTGFGYALYSYDDLTESMDARMDAYTEKGPVRCFVNVGGNLPSFGRNSALHTVPGGILKALPSGEAGDGLAQRFLSGGIPVIQLLNMKGLLPAYGLPLDPVPLPPDGAGFVYRTEAYSLPLLIAVACLGVCGVGRLGFQARRRGKLSFRGDSRWGSFSSQP